jgi:4-amino-4-deoxy-L-arabinose transferase-like glycosyltransferase
MLSGFKGASALIIMVVVVIGFMVWLPALRWFFLISLVLGLVAAIILHFIHKRPVKTPEDKQIRLNLDK